MKRIVSILLGGMLTLSVFTGCAAREPEHVFIMADVQEDEHPTARASDSFAKMVKDRTNGRIEIEVYHGSTLGTEAQQVAQVTVGGVDFVRTSSSVISNYDNSLKAFQALYLFDNDDSMWKVLDGEYGQSFLTTDALTQNNIEGLCWFSGGSRNFYNNKKVIKTPQDLNGLKLRVNTDSMFALLNGQGCEGINVAYGDILDSIKAGVIDGAENNWPSYISTEHYTVAPNITIDEHTRIPEMIIASKSVMDTLSPEDAKIVRECAMEASKQQREWMQEFDEEAIKTAEEAGCTITYLTPDEIAQFQKAAEPVNAEVSAEYMDIIKKLQAGQ